MLSWSPVHLRGSFPLTCRAHSVPVCGRHTFQTQQGLTHYYTFINTLGSGTAIKSGNNKVRIGQGE